jgi:hypothetical protein
MLAELIPWNRFVIESLKIRDLDFHILRNLLNEMLGGLLYNF